MTCWGAVPEDFVPYAQWLTSLVTAVEAEGPQPPEPPAHAPSGLERTNERWDVECDAALGEARRFRAALREALEAVRADLLRDVAADVLGRELRLAPVELEAIVERACARYRIDEPLAVRVSPGEGRSLGHRFHVIEDAGLRAGDLQLEVRCGEIDARLGARLERVLAAFA